MASNIFNIIRLAQLNESEISGLTVQIFDELFSGFGTGQLTGTFYPLNSNPLNYITSGQTGIFITNGQTGVLLTYNDPRLISTILSQTTPLFYPLNSNPNNYISSTQTGEFIGTGILNNLALLNESNTFSQPNIFNNSFNSNVLSEFFGVVYFDALIKFASGMYLEDVQDIYFLDPNNRLLYNQTGQATIDFNKLILTGGNWDTQGLSVLGNSVITDNQTGQFLTNSQIQNFTGNFSNISGNYTPTGIIDSSGINSVNWIYRLLSDTTGINSVNWGSRYLYDGTQIALGPNDYGNISLDWGRRILSGNWNVSGNLMVNGISVTTGTTGSFVTTGQTGNFATTGNLNLTGEYLYGLIQTGNAGVSSLNSKSGMLNLVGAGNVSVTTNNQTITVNGNTGAYANFAKLYSPNFFTSTNTFESPTFFLANLTTNAITNLNGPSFISGNPILTSNQTGVLTGAFARLYTDNTFTSKNKFNSGIIIGGNASSISFSNPLSGTFNYFNWITDSNGKNILAFGKLFNIPVRNLIDEHSIGAISFTSGLRYLYDNLGNISIDYNNRILTGGNWKIQGFTGGGGIGGSGTQVQVTGSSYLTIANFTGIGGAQVILSGNQILISGGAGNGTGSGIVNYFINSGSGAYIFSTPATSGVSSQFINFPTNLGNNPFVLCALSNLSGSDNIFAQPSGITSSGYWAQYLNPINSNAYVVTTMAAISTSTGLATTVIINNNVSVNGSTGSYVFRTNINSGINSQFISFPQTLDSSSRVISTLGNNSFGDLFLQQTSGVTSSGFWAIFSDNIDNSGYYLDTIACISTNTGLATTVIINTGASVFVTGLSINNPNFTGIGGTQVTTSGNFVLISGGGSNSNTGNYLPLSGGTISGNVQITGNLTITGKVFITGGFNVSGILTSLNDGLSSVDLNNRVLWGGFNTTSPVFDWQHVEIYDEFGYQAINLNDTQRRGYAGDGTSLTIDWGLCQLISKDFGFTYIDWNSGVMYNDLNVSIDYLNRVLCSDTGITHPQRNITLDYQNRILTGGIWNTQSLQINGSGNFTSGIYVNGVSITTSIQPWQYLSGNTGNILWNAQPNVVEDKQILIITGNVILSISGLYNGWGGSLQVIQSGFYATGTGINGLASGYNSGSGYNITLPTNTRVQNGGNGSISLTQYVSGVTDLLGFEFNGTNLMCGIGYWYN